MAQATQRTRSVGMCRERESSNNCHCCLPSGRFILLALTFLKRSAEMLLSSVPIYNLRRSILVNICSIFDPQAVLLHSHSCRWTALALLPKVQHPHKTTIRPYDPARL